MGARDDRKVTPGITELSRPRAHSEDVLNYTFEYIDGAACYIDVGSSYPGCAETTKLKQLGAVGGQGWGCSPIKRVRELGSERCEAVCLISTGNVRCLKGRIFQYERNEGSRPLVYRISDKVKPGSYALEDKC